MIIINTTYQADPAVSVKFVNWLREEYVVRAIKSCALSMPHLSKVLGAEGDGECYALQFKVESTAILHRWFVETGQPLSDELVQLFGSRVVGFTTLLEEIEL